MIHREQRQPEAPRPESFSAATERRPASGRFGRAALCLLAAVGLPWFLAGSLPPGTAGRALAQAAPAAEGRMIDPRQDAHIEKLLSQGRIVRTARTRLGVTDPLRVWVEADGETISGCFKYVDLQSQGITRVRGGQTELNFTDRHIYDQASYRLDRELGLYMVPVAVSRRVRRLRGSLVHWLDDVVDETQRLKESLPPQVSARIHRRKNTMLVFDALIDNVDRNAGNLLYTTDSWDLYLIDHTRAFRTQTQLREDFLERSVTLPRPFYDRLRGLEETRLQTILKGLLSKARISALLARRDLIVEKIEAERRQRGDDAVFQATATAPAAEAAAPRPPASAPPEP